MRTNPEFPAQGSHGGPTGAGAEAPFGQPSGSSERVSAPECEMSLEKMGWSNHTETGTLACDGAAHFFWAGREACCCGQVAR